MTQMYEVPPRPEAANPATAAGEAPANGEVPSRRPSRRGLWIGLGALGGVLAAFLVLLLVGVFAVAPSVLSKTLVASDFNGGKGPFVAESDPYVTLAYVDGGYVTHLNAGSPPPPQMVRTWFPNGTVHAFKAQIDATVRSSSGQFVFGVGAWNGPSADYLLVTTSQGGAALLKEADAHTGDKTFLAQVNPTGVATTNVHFTFEVRGGGNSPTELTGAVNGVPVHATDPNGFDSFSGVGLWITAQTGPVDILWDNITVTGLNS